MVHNQERNSRHFQCSNLLLKAYTLCSAFTEYCYGISESFVHKTEPVALGDIFKKKKWFESNKNDHPVDPSSRDSFFILLFPSKKHSVFVISESRWLSRKVKKPWPKEEAIFRERVDCYSWAAAGDSYMFFPVSRRLFSCYSPTEHVNINISFNNRP